MTFDEAFAQLLIVEGGYSKNPYDSGGETRYGITKKMARKYGYAGEMKNLPVALAKDIYYVEFWDPVAKSISGLSYPIAYEVFDSMINHGDNRAVMWLQQSLNVLNRNGDLWLTIAADGKMGPHTMNTLEAAIAHKEEENILFVYRILRGSFYIKLCQQDSTQDTFIRGWLSRLGLELKKWKRVK